MNSTHRKPDATLADSQLMPLTQVEIAATGGGVVHFLATLDLAAKGVTAVGTAVAIPMAAYQLYKYIQSR